LQPLPAAVVSICWAILPLFLIVFATNEFDSSSNASPHFTHSNKSGFIEAKLTLELHQTIVTLLFSKEQAIKGSFLWDLDKVTFFWWGQKTIR
jgi:hypothetical protein